MAYFSIDFVNQSHHNTVVFTKAVIKRGEKTINFQRQQHRKQYILLIISHAMGTFLKGAAIKKTGCLFQRKGENGNEKLEYDCVLHK